MTTQDTRALVGQDLGLAGFDGSTSAYQALTPVDQERVSIATVQYIIAHPDRFTPEQVQTAKVLAAKPNFGATGDYSSDPLDNATAFLKAYGETVGDLTVGAAGVAGKSLSSLGINLSSLLGIAAVVAILYFGSPYVVPKLKASLRK